LRRQASLPGFALAWLLASSVKAAPVPAANVWYRASDACPVGADFLAKLGDRAALARIADAGDHFHFVVTLVEKGGETIGRLERQTDRGTVAVRELRDADCSRVADAMALSLGLALQPATDGMELASSSGSLVASPAVEPAAQSSAVENETPAAPVAQMPKTADAPPTHSSAKPKSAAVLSPRPTPIGSPTRGAFGIQVGAISGVVPATLPRGEAFLNIENVWPSFSRNLSLRFSGVGAFGSTSTVAGSVDQWLLAGRGEGCPWRFGSERLGISPCLAVEFGAVNAKSARTGQSALGTWLAVAGGARASLDLFSGLALEAQLEAQLAPIQGEVVAGPVSLYQADLLVFQGGLGLSLRLW